MQMSSRIHEADMIYMSFWLILVGAPVFFIAWVLRRIEHNTRR